MIPYQEIRDTLKDSDVSMSLLKSSQESALKSDKPTYLMFFDSSIESFRTIEGIGVLSCYDKMVQKYHNQKNSYPVVISTGYRIDSEKYPLHSKRIDYDMDVRTKTNKWNENSVYPPEPNFGILPLPYKKIESCGNGQKNYESPNEAPNMVSNIIKERKLNTNQPGIVFKGKHAVQMEIRPRMLGDEKEGDSGKVNFRGDILHWNQQFFKRFRNISQSHFKPLQWANSTLNKYELKAVILYVDKNGVLSDIKDKDFTEYKLNKGEVKCMLASLLSKLFTAYDPISICNKISTDDFRDTLITVLKTYPQKIPCIENDTKKRSHVFYTNYFDKTTTLEEIKHYVCLLSVCVGESFDNINQAAKSAGFKIYDNLYRDCFSDHPKWVEALLKQFINEFIPTESGNFKLTDTTTLMIKAICEDDFSSKGQGNFKMSYLHLAALAGNTNYVELLLKNNFNKNLKAEHSILPLHCAIKYHIKHDEDYDFEYKYETDLTLIELLADSENIFYKMANGKSALYTILTELPHPEIVIERLYKKNYIEEYDYKLLVVYTTMLRQNCIAFEEFNNPLIHIIEHIKADEVAAQLIRFFAYLGAGINENHCEDNNSDDESILDSPLFLAIRRGGFQLVKAISDAQGAFCEVFNHQGLPPLLYALHKKASDSILKTLYDCGACLLETNLGADWDNYTFNPILQTCAIVEIIRPNLGGIRNLNLLEYILANEDLETIMDLLLSENYDEDRSDDEDDEDGSQSVLDILIEEEDIEALQVIFNKNGMQPDDLLDRLCDKKCRKILKMMPEMHCESGPRF
jgi:ankyrin repeat protein